jgi:hypothetical protein
MKNLFPSLLGGWQQKKKNFSERKKKRNKTKHNKMEAQRALF